MPKRTLKAVVIAFALTFAATAFWSADTTGHGGDDATEIVVSDGAKAGANLEAPKKKGNRFARFFKAPFKAVAKMFDGDGGEKMSRMNAKDGEKFESAPVVRVDDANSPAAKYDAGGGTSARDYFERGRAALDAGDLSEAVTLLSRAVALDAKLTQPHNLLAVAYDRKGLRDRARASYERAIDSAPADAQALNNLGYSLYLSGNYRAAVEKLKRAAKMAPADERILNNLALAQARLGKYTDAYKNFARAGGELTGHLNVAALLERTGRDADAIEHYEAARKLQPGSEVALRRLADLYGRAGRADRAAQARAALEALPREALAAKE